MSTPSQLSSAALDFLKKFDGYPMSQRDIEHYYGNQGWEQALGAPVASVVSAFKETNLIRLASATEDTAYLADHLIHVSDIKALLKQEGLKVSGKNGDLIERLLEHKPSALVAALPDEPFWITTDIGRALVNERANARRSRREQCELAVLDFIREGRISNAIQAWNQYAKDEPYASSIDSDRLNREINILNTIRHDTCAYLADRLPLEAIDALRSYAAVSHICGSSLTQAALDKLTPDLERFQQLAGGQSAQVCARMLKFYAISEENLRSFKQMGYRLVSTSDCSESCQYCQDQSKTKHPIEQAPELPHSMCTHAMGCRCSYMPHAES